MQSISFPSFQNRLWVIFLPIFLLLGGINTANAQKAQGDVSFQSGIQLYNNADYPKAIAAFNDAIKAYKAEGLFHTKAYTYRGKCKRNSYDYNGAIQDFGLVIDAAPTYARAYRYRGYCLYLEMRYEEAILDLNNYIRIANPYREEEFEKGYHWRGLCEQALEDHASAIADFTKAITWNKNFADGYIARSQSYENNYQFKEALEDCVTYLTMPENAAKACELALVYAKYTDLLILNEETESALNTIDELADNCKEEKSFFCERKGDLLANKSRFEEAIKAYKEALIAITEKTYQTPLLRKIGDTYLYLDNTVSAIYYYTEALNSIEYDPFGEKAQLQSQIDLLKKASAIHNPTIAWSLPTSYKTETTDKNFFISACIASETPVSSQIFLNNMASRGQSVVPANTHTGCSGTPAATTLTLKEGENVVHIEATNQSGKTISENRIIVYTPFKPKLELESNNVVQRVQADTTARPPKTEKRLALVIGNSSYANAPLKNPVNDAKAMQKALTDCGFEVMEVENTDKKTLKASIKTFTDKLKDYDVGLFFYAGHGMEVEGINYILPVDVSADLKKSDVTEGEEGVKTDWIQGRMADAGVEGKTYILILDACRNNPFRSWTRATPNAEAWVTPQNLPSGIITCYATSQGEVAQDGVNGNGLYTSTLLKYMKLPNIPIEQVFKKVRVDLVKEGGQEPVESTKLTQDFYFIKK